MHNPIQIGIIGVGGIGVGAHMGGYQNAQGAKVVAICDVNPARLKEIGDKFEIPEALRFTDYHDLLACGAVDAVDICTPNDSHCAIGLAAVEAGKPFNIEKPLGISIEETEALLRAADEKHIKSQICFSYRFFPAVRYAKKLIDEGKIGRIHSIYASYLKDSAYWEGRRLDWRFDEKIARYGVSGDLAVHILDTVRFLAGDYDGLIAQMDIIVKERKKLDSEEIVPVTTDDVCNFFARMKNGASATFGVSRAASGNKNRVRAEIYGEKGGFRFDLTDPKHMEIAMGGHAEMEEIEIPEEYRYPQQQSFIDLLNGKDDPWRPQLRDGVKLQYVLEALMESAGKDQWVKIKE